MPAFLAHLAQFAAAAAASAAHTTRVLLRARTTPHLPRTHLLPTTIVRCLPARARWAYTTTHAATGDVRFSPIEYGMGLRGTQGRPHRQAAPRQRPPAGLVTSWRLPTTGCYALMVPCRAVGTHHDVVTTPRTLHLCTLHVFLNGNG